MSKTQIIEVQRFRLSTVDEIKRKIGYSEIKCSDSHITSIDRKIQLGVSIKKHLNNFRKNYSQKYKHLPQETVNLLQKNYALHESLRNEGNSLFSEIICDKINKQIPALNSVMSDLLKNNLDINLSNKQEMSNKLNDYLNEFEGIVKDTHILLKKAEIDILNQKSMNSLSSIGYEVQNKKNDSEIIIRGSKNDVSVAISINNDGEMSLDMAGFENHECENELKQIHDKFKQNGIEMKVKSDIYHGKKEGGVLIQKVQKEFKKIFSEEKQKENKIKKVSQLKKLQFLKLNQKIRS
jgi:hypothetical protein